MEHIEKNLKEALFALDCENNSSQYGDIPTLDCDSARESIEKALRLLEKETKLSKEREELLRVLKNDMELSKKRGESLEILRNELEENLRTLNEDLEKISEASFPLENLVAELNR